MPKVVRTYESPQLAYQKVPSNIYTGTIKVVGMLPAIRRMEGPDADDAPPERDYQKGLYVVARILFLLLLNSSAWPCLGPA